MDVRSAEFTKYAANAMLATRISFMNELANLADQVGADIELVRQGIGSDPRIGYSFLYAGVGYGGCCFPKDVQALVRTAREHGQRTARARGGGSRQPAQKHVLVNKILARYGARPDAARRLRRCGAWPSSPTPTTCAMRRAASSSHGLLRAGASMRAHDPVAMAEAPARCCGT